MKNMFKVMSPVALLLALAACGAAANDAPAAAAPTTEQQPVVEAPADDQGAEEQPGVDLDIHVALVAHSPESILDDGSFNEGAWQGIQQFAATHSLPANQMQFFQPHEASDVARIDLIADAISGGANFIVLPGFHFEASAAEAQVLFPDVKFVLLDASPTGDIAENLVAIHYAEEEAGFLAGYAAVMEGHRHLGFMGGIAVPAVVRFGHGFIQGAEHAATVLGLEAGEIVINYTYLGAFAPSPEVTTQANAWFASGVEVIFVAAGGAGFSVFGAAEQSNALAIGVDVNQAADSETVMTSAMKGLGPSVYAMLTDFMNGNFQGGQEMMFNAAIDGVGLPMADSRFEHFTTAQYDAIFAELANGSIVVNNSLQMGDIVAPTVDVIEM